MKKHGFVKWLLINGILMSFVFCGSEEKVRKYSEKVDKKTVSKMKSPHHGFNHPKSKGESKYEWEMPSEWKKGSGGSRMRLATFVIESEDGTGKGKGECTIIPLSGDGGGLIPNVQLWLDQIGIKLDPKDEIFKGFIEKKKLFTTTDGMNAVGLDMTELVADPNGQAVLVSMIDAGDSTVFIKLRGPKKILVTQRDVFNRLSRSFRKKKNDK